LKNCVVFNDLSGYGNCSLMAAVPVLTVMGVRAYGGAYPPNRL